MNSLLIDFERLGQNGANGTKKQCYQKFLYEPTDTSEPVGSIGKFQIRVSLCHFVTSLLIYFEKTI